MLEAGSSVPDVMVWAEIREEARPLKEVLGPGLSLLCSYVYDWSWRQLHDPQRARAKRLGAGYQPHFILLDVQGRIVDTHEGAGDSEIWDALLAKLP